MCITLYILLLVLCLHDIKDNIILVKIYFIYTLINKVYKYDTVFSWGYQNQLFIMLFAIGFVLLLTRYNSCMKLKPNTRIRE